MNILWIPNFCPFPPNNGGKVVIYNRILQVSKKHNIFLVTEEDEETVKNLSDYASLVCKEFIIVPKEKKSTIMKMLNILKTSRNVEKYRNKNITREVEKIIKREKIDLINIDLPMPIINLLDIQNLLENIPIIVNQHNIEFNNVRSKMKANGVSLPMKIYAGLESTLLYKWERSIYSKGIISAQSFVSPEDLASFKTIFGIGNDVELLCSPIGVDPIDYKEHKFQHTSIVFVASFDYPPNIHGAIWFVDKVFPLICEQIPNAQLYLVGRNPHESIEARKAKNIHVTGTVDSVIPYCEMADIFVVPVFLGGGVKTKLIEAGIFGKPIVATSLGAYGTEYKHLEDIFITDKEREFADYCITLLENPENYQEVCNRLRAKTERLYLWDSIGRQYITFLERNANKIIV